MNPTGRKKCRVARPSGFCDSLLDTFGKSRISIISGFIWKRTQTTQTQPSHVFQPCSWLESLRASRPSAAATRRSRSFHSRAAAAAALALLKSISKLISNAKAAAKQVASVRATATRCAPKAHQRYQRFFSKSVLCSFPHTQLFSVLLRKPRIRPLLCKSGKFSGKPSRRCIRVRIKLRHIRLDV